ncbi:MAG: peptidase S8 and S53 subtilisin kexin sedolisin [Proteobacteria bacterium]|nr:MAG: peptidase S8 and S53 subtilisin kexin sedolisin [Pseudomonadota bacterium]
MRKNYIVLIWAVLLPYWANNALAHSDSGVETSYDSPSCHIASSWCVGRHKNSPVKVSSKRLSSRKKKDFVPDELLLLYDSAKPNHYADQLIQRYHLKEKRSDELASIRTRMVTVGTNGQDASSLLRCINKQEKTIKANLSSLFYISAVSPRPSNTNAGGYPLALTGVSAIHRFTRGAGVKICLVDTPVDLLHTSLDTSKVKRFELLPQGNFNNQRHGTQMAGVLISQNPLIGIAPDANLLAVSAFGNDPDNRSRRRSTAGTIAKAIDLCIRNKVDIINMSFAGGKDDLVNRMVKKAADVGIVVVASAGNGGLGADPVFPAALDEVIAVTAVDWRESVFPSANRGNYIDLAAPGVEILTTSPRQSFATVTGTSVATAHVTGAIALIMSLDRQGFDTGILERTAADLGKPGRDPEYGFGLINIERALNALGKAKVDLELLSVKVED